MCSTLVFWTDVATKHSTKHFATHTTKCPLCSSGSYPTSHQRSSMGKFSHVWHPLSDLVWGWPFLFVVFLHYVLLFQARGLSHFSWGFIWFSFLSVYRLCEPFGLVFLGGVCGCCRLHEDWWQLGYMCCVSACLGWTPRDWCGVGWRLAGPGKGPLLCYRIYLPNCIGKCLSQALNGHWRVFQQCSIVSGPIPPLEVREEPSQTFAFVSNVS